MKMTGRTAIFGHELVLILRRFTTYNTVPRMQMHGPRRKFKIRAAGEARDALYQLLPNHSEGGSWGIWFHSTSTVRFRNKCLLLEFSKCENSLKFCFSAIVPKYRQLQSLIRSGVQQSTAPACSQPPHGANDFSVAGRTKDSKGVPTLPQLLRLRYLTDSHFPTSDNDRV